MGREAEEEMEKVPLPGPLQPAAQPLPIAQVPASPCLPVPGHAGSSSFPASLHAKLSSRSSDVEQRRGMSVLSLISSSCPPASQEGM